MNRKTTVARLQKTIDQYKESIRTVEVITDDNKWVLHVENLNAPTCERLQKVLNDEAKGHLQIEVVLQEGGLPAFSEEEKKTIKNGLKSLFPAILLTPNNWEKETGKVSIPVFQKDIFQRFKEENAGQKISSLFFQRHNKKLEIDLHLKDEFEEISKEIEENKKNLTVFAPKETEEAQKKKVFGPILGNKIKGPACPIAEAASEETVVVEGKIRKIDQKEIRNNRSILSFDITDYTSSLTCKAFIETEKASKIHSQLQEKDRLKVKGKIQFDTFARENIFIANNIEKMQQVERMDEAEVKRIELHAHTQYSSMDGVAKIKDLIQQAKEFGHEAIAITDHGVLQAYPEAMDAAKEHGIKIIYGLEGYLVDDGNSIKWGPKQAELTDTFVVFDIETTGLSPKNSEIIEIGAAKINNGQVIESYQSFVKPKGPIPLKITELTGITSGMVEDARDIKTVLEEFLSFINDSVLVAHNAKFDMSFLESELRNNGFDKEFTVVDTLGLARASLPQLGRFNLKRLCSYFKINLDNHHRASDDAIATAKVYLALLDIAKANKAEGIDDFNHVFDQESTIKRLDTNHIIILVKNQTGLKNLYKLVSLSHLRYFHKKPRLPKSVLNRYREGLIFGTACESGELYKALLSEKSSEEIAQIVSFYDYLEVQPIGNNEFLMDKDIVGNKSELQEINRNIVQLGEHYQKPVVATGDVHFIHPEDECYRKVLMYGQKFSDFDRQPPLYYRTTQEMLDEFSYLDEEKAKEIVVENPNRLAQSIEDILPIPDGTFPPIIEGSDREIREMVYETATETYGENLPEEVKARMNKELDSIIDNGYSVLYLVAHKLVKKSIDDGYLVGSRGSVGSSLAATFSGITEVNPLRPHYVCPSCHSYEFFDSAEVGSGPDLKDKECPNCKIPYKKDGFDIPFEVFLGFEGDKEPDIDLNFSGEYQGVAHKYTEELFGEGYVFRAGTISTIADKTAFGFVKNYLEENDCRITNAEIDRLVEGCTGIKRTTGQHPGGIMVVPSNKDIYDFTPIQRPADDTGSETITTHFDYNSISGRLLKLDILGHDDPTMIKMLEDLTGINAVDIPLDDEKTMSLFLSTEALNLKDPDIETTVGTYGVPEFGTNFVREMLIAIQPTAFSDLIKISGLSHGTDVWLNNAQTIIEENIATIKEVICTRDDIMVYLIHKGLPKKSSFTIMEKVRKGKGLTNQDIALMKEHEVPQWYIESCQKIKYMFPKAHAVAYVTMAFRIAYFKVHYPLAYYATYFSVRADDFDAHIAVQGVQAVRKAIKEIKALGNQASAKDKNTLTALEVTLEMLCRGFEFMPVSLYESHYEKFLILENRLLPPFRALAGIGLKASENIYRAKEDGPFISVEDLQNRSKISKTNIEILKKHGTLGPLPDTNQISLF